MAGGIEKLWLHIHITCGGASVELLVSFILAALLNLPRAATLLLLLLVWRPILQSLVKELSLIIPPLLFHAPA